MKKQSDAPEKAAKKETPSPYVEQFSACAGLETRLIPDIRGGGKPAMKKVAFPLLSGPKELEALQKRFGCPADVLLTSAFGVTVSVWGADPEKARILSSIIAYNQAEGQTPMVENQADNTYTMNVLHRLGFRWDETSRSYVDMIFEVLDSFRFFEV